MQTTVQRAWNAVTIDVPATWYYAMPRACMAALELMGGDLGPLPGHALATCAAALQPVLDALERGRGFAILQSPPLPAPDLKRLYWIVGQALGTPFAQNVEGTMLYDVRDTGQDVSKGARFSVTSYESSFHTDNSFGAEILDYVGLLCLHVAKSGGRSQILSGYAVRNELAARHPEALAVLSQPFHVDRRGGLRPGDAPTIQVPVIQQSGGEVVIRYLRYWIDAGHAKIGQPLTREQIAALDTLDACLRRPDLRVEFDLKPGDMYFINNRWTLHNRTAFEDHADPDRRRHLVRLWLRAPLAA
jgi:alpha-ketoglutarate-dependent taurine dioxygenase